MHRPTATTSTASTAAAAPAAAPVDRATRLAARPRRRRLVRARLLALAAVTVAGASAAVPSPGWAQGGAAVSWGENVHSQLGAGYRGSFEVTPVPVLGLGGITAMQAGYNFSTALLGGGTVDAWGGDIFGQLGDGSGRATWEKGLLEVAVPGLLGEVTAISAGGAHAMALLGDGTVMAWGTNQDGELGNGEAGVEKELLVSGREPRVVPGLSDVVAIASGGGSNFALLASGTLMAWGRNGAGQLGIGGTGPETCKTEVGEEPCSKVPREAKLSLPPRVTIKAISAGGGAAYALLSNGRLLSWGDNRKGQLGTNSENTPAHPPAPVTGTSGSGVLTGVRAISGGAWHALALLDTGQVVGWGASGRGALGEASGEVCNGWPCVNKPRAIAGLEGVSAISAGTGFSLAVSGGMVYSFGANNLGQLGNGTRADDSVPTAIPGLHGVAAVASGNMHALALLEPGVAAPAPLVSAVPGSGSIKLRWTVAAPEYGVRWKPASATTLGPVVKLTQSCSVAHPCGYAISGLSSEPYEVDFFTYLSEGVRVRRFLITPQP